MSSGKESGLGLASARMIRDSAGTRSIGSGLCINLVASLLAFVMAHHTGIVACMHKERGKRWQWIPGLSLSDAVTASRFQCLHVHSPGLGVYAVAKVERKFCTGIANDDLDGWLHA